jgi:hypothetical protein
MSTPSSSPAPVWRTGSCGESGPFIGLGYGWTCELACRMVARPEADPFILKTEMLEEFDEEPDLLNDFTEDEVIQGMAHYSWPESRTREFLEGLRAEVKATLPARLEDVAKKPTYPYWRNDAFNILAEVRTHLKMVQDDEVMCGLAKEICQRALADPVFVRTFTGIAEEISAALEPPAPGLCALAQKRGERCPGFILCFTCMTPQEQARAAASQWR